MTVDLNEYIQRLEAENLRLQDEICQMASLLEKFRDSGSYNQGSRDGFASAKALFGITLNEMENPYDNN